MAIRRAGILPIVFFVLNSFARAASTGTVTAGEGNFPPVIVSTETAEPVFQSLTRYPEPTSHVPTNVSVVTADEIRQLNAVTAADVLEWLPSVTMTKTGTLGTFSSLRMRGAPDAGDVQVLVDDLPLGGVAAQSIDLSQIPVEDIDHIEVVRGGSSVLYGANSTGGVVHIFTKRHTGDRPVSTIGIEAQSFKTRVYRGSLGGRGGGFDGLVDGQHYVTDGFQKTAQASNTSVSGNGGYTFKNGARISVAVSRYDSDAGDPQGTLLPLSKWDGSRERDNVSTAAVVNQNQDLAHVRAAIPLGNGGELQSVTFGSDQIYNYRLFGNGGPSSSRRTRIAGDDTRLLFPFGLLAGVSYEHDWQKTLNTYTNNVEDVGAYLQQTLNLGRLGLIPAARFDHHSAFGNTLNPRLTAVYRATEKLKFSANAARSFRSPNFDELFYQGSSLRGNSGLRPEVAWSYDAGAQFNTSKRTSVSVTGFYTTIKDIITLTNNSPSINTYVNAPRAEQNGVETEFAGRAGSFTGRVNYTYTQSVINSAVDSHYAPMRLTPRHMGNANLTWDLSKKWSVTNRLRYASRQSQFNDHGGGVLPEFAVWDLRLTRRILAAELYFGAQNILNRRYSEGFGNDPATGATTLTPQPRRTFVGGINIRFVD